jgi:hypothetical protein
VDEVHWRGGSASGTISRSVSTEDTMNVRGAGDRWLAGQKLPGVSFALHDSVRLTRGDFAGQVGSVTLLLALTPAPFYLVRLSATGRDVSARQSALEIVS